ncbi:MAG: transcription antitermination factor NusB, partial [Bacteroidales bacterium]|nr:transcription antitermination factor NusB [Bacteroidales bacterium]
MINRLLIRIKTVQLVYAFMQGSIDKLNSNEQMAQSLESSYQLYNYLLGLVVKLTEYRQTQLEAARKK